jgi:hypothetical protein
MGTLGCCIFIIEPKTKPVSKFGKRKEKGKERRKIKEKDLLIKQKIENIFIICCD